MWLIWLGTLAAANSVLIFGHEHHYLRSETESSVSRKASSTSFEIGGNSFTSIDQLVAGGHRCGTADPTPEELAMTLDLTQKYAAHKANVEADTTWVDRQIETWVHVVTSSSTSNGGLSQAAIDRQIKVMNNAYHSSGFSFYLANTTCTANDQWFRGNDERGMKKALRRGNAATLNLYFVHLTGGSLGYSTLPWRYTSDPVRDGVVCLDQSAVPLGRSWPYNRGDTAVHEAGHWLGLLHTFGGCYDIDQVADTPPELTSTTRCNPFKDTCQGDSFADPIHNYMDYAVDSCMSEFTPGQIDRMRLMWMNYRDVDYQDPGSIVIPPPISCG